MDQRRFVLLLIALMVGLILAYAVSTYLCARTLQLAGVC